MSELQRQRERVKAARERLIMNGRAHFERANVSAAVEKIRQTQVAAKKISDEQKLREWFDSGIVHTKPEIILKEVATKHDCLVRDLKSDHRRRALVIARHEACWRLYREADLSLPRIGRFLGNRDHTTILHGIRQHEKRMAEGAI